MRYRAEIDGVRAIAVTAVLLFHFFPAIFPLGYLGVDVFFVISGFLISTYIIKECEQGTFSFAEFYHRRVKRILPVVMVVLIVTSIVAALLFAPSNLRDYSFSLLSSLTFTANIYFWRNGGYFGLDNSIEPLLHMWSLGVEEQFYLVFPLLMVLLLSKITHKTYVFYTITAFCLLSFLACLVLIHKDLTAPVFFLLPARAWQFGVGVLAAMYFMKHQKMHHPLAELLIISALVWFFCLEFSHIPTGTVVSLLTALFLAKQFNPNGYLSFFFLNSFVRKIGLISFSLYLWHWPLVAFLNYYLIDSFNYWLMAAGLVVTYGLSVFSFRMIEEPFRRDYSHKVVYGFLAISMLTLVAFSAAVYKTHGQLLQASPLVTALSDARRTHFYCALQDYFAYQGTRACRINPIADKPPHIALLGNSHAQMYVPSLTRVLTQQQLSGVLVPLNGCLPTTDVNINRQCLSMATVNFQAVLSDRQIQTVILALTWNDDRLVTADGADVSGDKKLRLATSMLALVQQFKDAGKQVWVVGPIQLPGIDVASVLSRKLKFNQLTETEVLQLLKKPKAVFEQDYGQVLPLLEQQLGSSLLKPSDYLCDQDYCYLGNEHLVFFSDISHLSSKGTEALDPMFEQAFQGKP
jgi:peptidoglycan/LPS O-acetylase OafA/YrhL